LSDWAPLVIRARWAVGTKAIKLTLKRMRTPRRIRPDRRFGLPYEEVTLRTEDGLGLAGWFIPAPDDPERPGPPGVFAVVHHHYGGQKATVLPWLQLLHSRGIPALAIDGRGHGDSDLVPPGQGSFVRRAADMKAACAEVRRRGATRILALGQSMGAATTAIAVAGRADLAGVILDSGPAPDMGTAAWGLAGNLMETQREKDRLARFLLATRILPGTEPVGYPIAVWRALVRLRRVPLLWVHGGRDRVVERRWAATWYRVLRPRSGAWSCVEVPQAQHVRSLQTDGPPVEAAVDGFLDRVRAP
jgi:alpha-beta hydrolase superfamily lysophospholipase